MVNYKGQLCNHSFITVDGKRSNLLGRDMLRVIKIDWSDQALAYENQGRAIIAHLVSKFRGYRRVKSCMPPTKQACGGVR